jgi:hypothetical protein
MKRCSYCGAAYPDDTAVCAIDNTPLEGIQLESTHAEPPTFATTPNWNRILSTLVCIVYIILAFANGGAGFAFSTLGVSFVLLMIIWYADEIGSYTGATSSGWITSPTPAWIVRIFGWIFLLAPGLFVIYSITTRKH